MSGYFRLLTIVFSMVVATCVVGHEAKAQTREPVTPGDEEVAAHLLGTAPVIRMELSKFPQLRSAGAIPVELVVDEQGNVTSAKLQGEDEEDENDPEIKKLTKAQLQVLKNLVAEAKKAGMQLHFRPFEDGGRPMAAKFEIEIPLRALNEPPVKRKPFPQIHDWNSLKIILARTGCYGSCPSYEVEVHGDGTVLYEGRSFVAITGSHRASVSSRLLKKYSTMEMSCGTKRHAWRRSAAESCVQLFVAGGAGTERPSAACYPGPGGRSSGANVATV
jgi:hypothetical protein